MEYQVRIVSGLGYLDLVYLQPLFGRKPDDPARKVLLILEEPRRDSEVNLESRSVEQTVLFITISKVKEGIASESLLFEGQAGDWQYRGGFSASNEKGWIEIAE